MSSKFSLALTTFVMALICASQAIAGIAGSWVSNFLVILALALSDFSGTRGKVLNLSMSTAAAVVFVLGLISGKLFSVGGDPLVMTNDPTQVPMSLLAPLAVGCLSAAILLTIRAREYLAQRRIA